MRHLGAAGALLGALMLAGALGPPARAQEADEFAEESWGDDLGFGGGVEFRWGGRIQSDIRFQVLEKELGDWYDHYEIPVGVRRNENILNVKLDAFLGRISGVVDVDFVWLGVPEELSGIGDLSRRSRLEPYRLEAHALYAEIADIFVEGLDLRVGQQLVLWGVGDQFNPTNTLNANDLEDVLLFGEQRANLMVKLDYAPADLWVLSGVLIPIFKPALLPPSGSLALAAVDRLPFVEEGLRRKVTTEKHMLQQAYGFPTVVREVQPTLPETSVENMQLAFRVAGAVLEQDIALSYYRGFSDRPQPVGNLTWQDATPRCPGELAPASCTGGPDDPPGCARCIDGVLATSVDLRYPRMEVIGLNLAGEIPLGWIHEDVLPLGYRFEGGVYLPQRTEIRLEQEEIVVSGLTQPAGEYDYDMDGNPETKGRRPTVVPSTPFAKWVLALDYTFGRHLMTSVMWVHGLVDEYGAGDWTKPGWAVTKSWAEGDPEDPDDLTTCVTLDQLGMGSCPYEKYAVEITRPRIGDYVVLLLNLTLVDDRLLLRLFTLWDVRGVWEERWVADPDKPARTDWRDWTGRRVRKHHGMFTKKGYSGLIYPEINYNFGDGFDLGAGALFQLGNSYTKFGDPAASGSLVWTRVRYQY